MRKWTLAALGALLGLAAIPACSSGGGEESTSKAREDRGAPLHVLLIVIDTLRADHLSCYGYWRETSPNMDAMAKRGVLFTRAISQSSWTAPSMVTMMTGQRVSGPHLVLPEDRPALAELFRDAGFRTGAWVANDLLSISNGYHRGFERWTGERAWHKTKPPGLLEPILDWFAETAEEDSFTWVHFTDPHDPYLPPKDERSGIEGRLGEHRERLIAEAAERRELKDTIAAQAQEIARQVGLYDDEIKTVDRKVRRLLLGLEEHGGLENAIVVLTSDHGECLWERAESERRVALQEEGRGDEAQIQNLLKKTHGDFVYQELVHVPLIIMAPGLERGQVIDTLAEAVHLPSTILALADVRVAGVEELSGVDLFGREAPPGAYTMTKLGEAFIGPDGWKLILPTEMGREEFGRLVQLYDLNADPAERENLAEERPDKVAELEALLAERRASALPQPPLEVLRAQHRAAKQALQDLGYAGGGHADDLVGGEGADSEGGGGDPH